VLYGHSQNLSSAMALIQRTLPKHWKWIGNSDPSDLFNAAFCGVLGVKLIVRHPGLDGLNWKQEAIQDPYGLAERFVNDFRNQPYYAYADYCETPNEVFPIVECPGEYLVFLSECVRLFEQDGKQCIVGNFGTAQGVPPVVPGARHYGIHTYFGESRHWGEKVRELYDALPLDAEVWVTECGFTAALGTTVPPGQDNDYGWNGRISAEDYAMMLQLRDEDFRVMFGDRYRGAAVFQAGADPDWAGTFDVLGSDVERLLWPDIPWVNARPSPTMTIIREEGAAMPEYVLGFKELAERLGTEVVGDPQVNQDTLHDPDGSDILTVQTTTKGVFFYQPGASPVFLPART